MERGFRIEVLFAESPVGSWRVRLLIHGVGGGDGGGVVGVEWSEEVYTWVVLVRLGIRERFVRDYHRSFRTAVAINLKWCTAIDGLMDS